MDEVLARSGIFQGVDPDDTGLAEQRVHRDIRRRCRRGMGPGGATAGRGTAALHRHDGAPSLPTPFPGIVRSGQPRYRNQVKNNRGL